MKNDHWHIFQGNEYWKFINKDRQVRGQRPKLKHAGAEQNQKNLNLLTPKIINKMYLCSLPKNY